MKHRPALRVVSGFLAFFFLSQDLSFAAVEIGSQNHLFSSVSSPVLDFPSSIALVEDSHKAGSSKTLILFQDAHTNESAQNNLARSLELTLSKVSKPMHVFIEAGTGDDSLSYLRDKASLDKRREVASSFLRKGLLNGAEYLDLTSDRPFILWGVENKDLYWQSIRSYKEVAKDREELNEYLSSIDWTIQTLKPRLLNPALLSFDKKREDYLKEKLPMTDYMSLLLSEAKKHAIPSEYYPHLVSIQKVRELESNIDFSRANEEQNRVLSAFSREELEVLLKDRESSAHSPFKLSGKKHEGQDAFYAKLSEKTKGFEGSPELAKYAAYLKAIQAVSPKELLKEEKLLEDQIYQVLSKTNDEKNLLSAAKVLKYLKALGDMSLTPEEFEDYKLRASQGDLSYLTGFLNKKIMDLGDSYERALFMNVRAEQLITKAEEFYLLTYDRDKAFIRNALQKMDEEKEDTSILITGGFHTTNLKSLLKNKDISYVVVTPQVFYETNHARYEKILLSQLDLSPLDLDIQSKKLNGVSYDDGAMPLPIKNTPHLNDLHEALGVDAAAISGARLSASADRPDGVKLRESTVQEKIAFIADQMQKPDPSPLTYFAVQWLGVTDRSSSDAKKAVRALAGIVGSDQTLEGIREVAAIALAKLDPDNAILNEIINEAPQTLDVPIASELKETARGDAGAIFHKISELTREGEAYEGIRVNGLYIGRSELAEYAQKHNLEGPSGLTFALSAYLRVKAAAVAGKDAEIMQNIRDLYHIDPTSPLGLKEGDYVLYKGRIDEGDNTRNALVIEPAAQPISGARLAGRSVKDGLPQAFADNFARYGFDLEDISMIEVVNGRPQDLREGENPLLNSVRSQLIIGTTALQALAGASYAGMAKQLGMKEDAFGKIADGAAVTVGSKAMEYLAKAYDVTIVIAGNEGKTRDGSAALPEGDAINPGGKNGLYLYIGDSIEVTNGVKAGVQGSSSMMALFPANIPFEIDGYRISLWSDFPSTPGIDPIVTKNNSLKNILTQLAQSKGVSIESLPSAYEILTLDRGKNSALIEEARELGFAVHLKGDGDPIPGILRGIYGIPGENGKKLIVVSTGGGNEHRMAQIVATLQAKSKIATTYASTVSLKAVDKASEKAIEEGRAPSGDLESARMWQAKDLDEFVHTNDAIQETNAKLNLQIPLLPTTPEALNTFIQDETSLSKEIRGQAAMGITSITGALSTDAGILRHAMTPVTYTLLSHGKGAVEVKGFVVNEEGRLFFFDVLLRTQNLLESRDRILSENEYGLTDDLKERLKGGTASLTTEEGVRKLIIRPTWGVAVPNIDEKLAYIVETELNARFGEAQEDEPAYMRDKRRVLKKYLEALAYWMAHENFEESAIRLELEWIIEEFSEMSFRKIRAALAEITKWVRDTKVSPDLSRDPAVIHAVSLLARMEGTSHMETVQEFGAFRSNLKTVGESIEGAKEIKKFSSKPEDGRMTFVFDMVMNDGTRVQKKMVPVTGARLAQLEKILSLKPDLENYPPMRSEAVGNYTPQIANVLSLYYEVKDAKEAISPKTRRAKDLKSSDPKVLDEAIRILDEKVDRLDLERLLNYVRTMKNVRMKSGEIRGLTKSGKVDVEVIVSDGAVPTITEKVGTYQSTYDFKRFPLEEAQLRELLARMARSVKAPKTAASKGARLATYTVFMETPALAGEAAGFFWKEGSLDFSKVSGRIRFIDFLAQNEETAGFANGFRQAHFTNFFENPKLLFISTKNKRDPGAPVAIVFRGARSRKLKIIHLAPEKVDYAPYVEILKKKGDPLVTLDMVNDFHPVMADVDVDISLERFDLKQPVGARLSPLKAGWTAALATFGALATPGAVKSEEPVKAPSTQTTAATEAASRVIAEKDGLIFNVNSFSNTVQVTDAAHGTVLQTIELPFFFRDYSYGDLQTNLTVTPNRKKAFIVMSYAVNSAHVTELNAYLVLDLVRGTSAVVDKVRRQPFLHENLSVLRNGSARVEVRSYDAGIDMLSDKVYKRSVSLRTPRTPSGARLSQETLESDTVVRFDGDFRHETYFNYGVKREMSMEEAINEILKLEKRDRSELRGVNYNAKRSIRLHIPSEMAMRVVEDDLLTVSFSSRSGILQGARLAAEQGTSIEIKKGEEKPIELKAPYTIWTPLQELEVRQSTIARTVTVKQGSFSIRLAPGRTDLTDDLSFEYAPYEFGKFPVLMVHYRGDDKAVIRLKEGARLAADSPFTNYSTYVASKEAAIKQGTSNKELAQFYEAAMKGMHWEVRQDAAISLALLNGYDFKSRLESKGLDYSKVLSFGVSNLLIGSRENAYVLSKDEVIQALQKIERLVTSPGFPFNADPDAIRLASLVEQHEKFVLEGTPFKFVMKTIPAVTHEEQKSKWVQGSMDNSHSDDVLEEYTETMVDREAYDVVEIVPSSGARLADLESDTVKRYDGDFNYQTYFNYGVKREMTVEEAVVEILKLEKRDRSELVGFNLNSKRHIHLNNPQEMATQVTPNDNLTLSYSARPDFSQGARLAATNNAPYVGIVESLDIAKWRYNLQFSSDPKVRSEAIRNLGLYTRSGRDLALRAALNEKDTEVRAQALGVLGHYPANDKEIESALIRVLEEPGADPRVYYAASYALFMMNSRSKEVQTLVVRLLNGGTTEDIQIENASLIAGRMGRDASVEVKQALIRRYSRMKISNPAVDALAFDLGFFELTPEEEAGLGLSSAHATAYFNASDTQISLAEINSRLQGFINRVLEDKKMSETLIKEAIELRIILREVGDLYFRLGGIERAARKLQELHHNLVAAEHVDFAEEAAIIGLSLIGVMSWREIRHIRNVREFDHPFDSFMKKFGSLRYPEDVIGYLETRDLPEAGRFLQMATQYARESQGARLADLSMNERSQITAIEKLKKLDRDLAISQLSQLLGNMSRRVNVAVEDALMELGLSKEDILDIYFSVVSGPINVRWAVSLDRLVAARDKRAADAVKNLKALNDDEWLYKTARHALVQFGASDSDLTQFYEKALKTASPEIHQDAAIALAKLQGYDFISRLQSRGIDFSKVESLGLSKLFAGKVSSKDQAIQLLENIEKIVTSPDFPFESVRFIADLERLIIQSREFIAKDIPFKVVVRTIPAVTHQEERERWIQGSMDNTRVDDVLEKYMETVVDREAYKIVDIVPLESTEDPKQGARLAVAYGENKSGFYIESHGKKIYLETSTPTGDVQLTSTDLVVAQLNGWKASKILPQNLEISGTPRSGIVFIRNTENGRSMNGSTALKGSLARALNYVIGDESFGLRSQGARLSSPALNNLEPFFIGVAHAHSSVINGSRLALDLKEDGSLPYIFTFTKEGESLIATSEGISITLDRSRLKNGRITKKTDDVSFIQDLRTLTDSTNNKITGLLDASGIDTNIPVILSIDLNVLDNNSSEFYLDYLIAELKALKKKDKNVSFILEGPEHLIALANDKDSTLFLDQIPQNLKKAPVVNLTPSTDLNKSQVNVPVTKLHEGDIPAFKGLLALSTASGRISTKNIPQNYQDAYSTLAGLRLQAQDIKAILEGTADQKTILKGSLKPITKVAINKAIQLFKTMIRMVGAAA